MTTHAHRAHDRHEPEGDGMAEVDEKFRQRRTRATREATTATCYLDLRGRVSLADLLAQVPDGVDLAEATIGGGCVVWHEPATLEETTHWLGCDERQQQRTEEWERRTLARLLDKYGADPRATAREDGGES